MRQTVPRLPRYGITQAALGTSPPISAEAPEHGDYGAGPGSLAFRGSSGGSSVPPKRDRPPRPRALLKPPRDRALSIAAIPTELDVRPRPGARRLSHPRHRDGEPVSDLGRGEQAVAHVALPLERSGELGPSARANARARPLASGLSAKAGGGKGR